MKRKYFAFFHYFLLDLTAGFRTGFRFRLFTPLFGLDLGLLAYAMTYDAREFGIRLSAIPINWKFQAEEGCSLYRYDRFFGWRFSHEFLRCLNWRIEQLIWPPKCRICGKRVRFSWKPFVPRDLWMHVHCSLFANEPSASDGGCLLG